jgi:hypothetical protein
MVAETTLSLFGGTDRIVCATEALSPIRGYV